MSCLSSRLRVGRGEVVHGYDELAQRLRAVLCTRPGTLPWRPDFGCGLADLVGNPASPSVLSEAEWRVRDALTRWVPDVEILSCVARAQPISSPAAVCGLAERWGHQPELGLLALGGEARLVVALTIRRAGGSLTLDLDLGP